MTSRSQRVDDRRRNALVSFALLFCLMGSYALLETARDTLFLSQLGAARLPWAVLATAAAVTLVTWLVPRARTASARRTAAVIAAGAAATFVMSVGFDVHVTFRLYVLYAAVGVTGTSLIVEAWTLIGAQFTVGEARRWFALVASGGGLGAIAGGALAAHLLAVRSAQSLIAVAAIALAGASGVPLLLRRSDPDAAPATTRAAPLARLVRTGYARRVFWMIVLATIAATGGDLLFKSTVAAHIPKQALGRFFALAQLTLSLLGLVMQVVIAPLVLRRVGASRVVLALPLATLGAALGFFFAPGMAGALGLKAIDGSLRSLHRTSTEVLYLPLPFEVRGRLKGLVDGVGQRGAQALASLLALGALRLGASSSHLAIGVELAALGCAGVALALRRHYVQAFRDQLGSGALAGHPAAAPLDLHSVESLVEMLSSPNDGRVLGALETLVAQGKASLVPSLLLYHPSSPVARRALELLARSGRRDFLPLTGRLLASDHVVLAGAAARVRALLLADEAELRQFAGDVRALVRAAGLVGLVHAGIARTSDWRHLARLERSTRRDEQQALLAAIAELPHAMLIPTAKRLAASDDPEVAIQAVEALARCGDGDHLALALRLLGGHATRERARRAFLDAGARGLEVLAGALVDPTLPLEVRRHVPRTISRIGTERAAAILLDGLVRGDGDGVTRYKMLRGLGRMKHDRPELRLDRTALRSLARSALSRTRDLRRWHASLDGGPAGRDGALLKALVARKQRLALERLFRVLDLLQPGADLERIHDGLVHPDEARRAASRELLEHVVDRPLRYDVLALVDDEAQGEEPLPLPAALAAMRADRSGAVRALAGELPPIAASPEVRHAS